MAFTFWLFGNSVPIIFGILAIGWDILERLDGQRDPNDGTAAADETRRELTPHRISQDPKFALLIALGIIGLLAVWILLLEAGYSL